MPSKLLFFVRLLKLAGNFWMILYTKQLLDLDPSGIDLVIIFIYLNTWYWLEVNKCAFTFSSVIRQIQCKRTEFWCVQCPRPAGRSAFNKHQIQASALNICLISRAKVNTNLLRVRAVFHKTVRVCHVCCNFKIGFTCRITVIFGTLKDGSLSINNLASNICFSYRNMFQNGVDALSKIVDAFLSKSSKFYLAQIIR